MTDYGTEISLAPLYRAVLADLLRAEPVVGYKGTDAEVLGAHFTIMNPRANLLASRARAFNYQYQVAEMIWNAQPYNRIDVLERVFPGVVRFVADQSPGFRHIALWAYGDSVYYGFTECLEELKRDLDTRRAVIRVETPCSLDTPGTPPCLTTIQFIHRGGKLHAFVNMRSNDVWRGLPLDVYQFSMWQAILAAKLGVEMGTYNHTAVSLHLYAHDRVLAQEFIEFPTIDVESSVPPASVFDELMTMEPILSMQTREIKDTLSEILPWLNTYFGVDNMMGPEFYWLRSNGYGHWT